METLKQGSVVFAPSPSRTWTLLEDPVRRPVGIGSDRYEVRASVVTCWPAEAFDCGMRPAARVLLRVGDRVWFEDEGVLFLSGVDVSGFSAVLTYRGSVEDNPYSDIPFGPRTFWA